MAKIPQLPPSLWDLGQEAWFSALALQNRPETFNGYSRGTKTDDVWFPDVVFMEVYPDAPVPIDPKNAADVAAWKRIRETLGAQAAEKQKNQPGDQVLAQPTWPLPKPPLLKKGGSAFKAKRPWSGTQTRWHTGQDLAAPAGMAVLAPEDGTIVAPNSGWESKVVKGQVIGVKALIMTTDSGKTLLLGGIRPGSAVVKAGERVKAGQQVAVIGKYPGGSSMLHLNVYQGKLTEAQVNAQKSWRLNGPQPKNLIDPTPYLKAAMANTPVVVGAFNIPDPPDDEIENGELDEGTSDGDAETAAAPTDESSPSSGSSPSSPSSGGSAGIVVGVVVVALLGVAFFGGR